MAKDKVLSIKVPIGLYDRMVREVELGEYTNVSDLIKVATRMHIQYLETTRTSDARAAYTESGGTIRTAEANDFTAEYDRGGGGPRSVDQSPPQESRN
ncbi:MAG: hypothetical protein LBJ20_01720 [Candidatus Methanoplasma sp.]|jgi:Arc/MetJ-type ribon-helix-helix transcriptional regulator|nr:hypothetical protein [Candidatus Methanoplasma sp.]